MGNHHGSPFDETEEANVILQEELLEVSVNDDLNVELKKFYQTFWLLAKVPKKYPGLWKRADLKL